MAFLFNFEQCSLVNNFCLQILNRAPSAFTLISKSWGVFCILKWILDRAIRNGTQGPCHPMCWSVWALSSHGFNLKWTFRSVKREARHKRCSSILRGLPRYTGGQVFLPLRAWERGTQKHEEHGRIRSHWRAETSVNVQLTGTLSFSFRPSSDQFNEAVRGLGQCLEHCHSGFFCLIFTCQGCLSAPRDFPRTSEGCPAYVSHRMSMVRNHTPGIRLARTALLIFHFPLTPDTRILRCVFSAFSRIPWKDHSPDAYSRGWLQHLFLVFGSTCSLVYRYFLPIPKKPFELESLSEHLPLEGLNQGTL